MLWLGPKDFRGRRKVPALSATSARYGNTRCVPVVPLSAADAYTQQMQPAGGHETWHSRLRQLSSTYSQLRYLQVPCAQQRSVSLLLTFLQMASWALRIAISLLLGSEISSASNQSSIICVMLRGCLCTASLMLLFKESRWITLADVEV